MVRRRWRSRAIASLAIVVLGANCTNDDEPDRVDPPTSSATDQAIRLGLPGPLVLDPASASLAAPAELMTVDLLFDGLTDIDVEGAPVPALAESWSADVERKIWTFVLDEDRTYTNGDPILAVDVVASLERLLRGGDSSLAALRLERLVGFRDFIDGRTPTAAGLRAVDDHTIELSFDEPLGGLPVLLAGPSYGIVDVEAVDGSAATGTPNLTGNWEASTTTDGSLTLERRRDAPGKLDTIELVPFADPVAAYTAFEEELVDWAEVPDDRVGDAIADYGDDAFSPFHAELLLGFNLGNVTLAQNQILRSVIAQSIDREAIVRAVYPDLADPLDQVVPAGVPGRTVSACATCEYDPTAAEQRLAAAYPSGVPVIHVDFDQSPAQEALARILATNLSEVGIQVKLRPRSLEDYKQFVVSGGHELFSFGWIAVYSSPDAYLTPLFGSSSDDNLVGFRSQDVDELLRVAQAAPVGDASAAAWADVERSVLEASVVVPIAQFRTQVVIAERVDGLRHTVDGTVDWSAVSVG